MKNVLNATRRAYLALFLLAGMFAYAAQPARAVEADIKGCWYEVGDEPACDICGWDCIDGQVCCTIEGGPIEA